jgi:hypothetical protein
VSAEAKQFFSALTADDLAHLDRQRAFVADAAVKLGLHMAMPCSLKDLTTLQAIVDSGTITKDQTWRLQSLGIALGDVFESNTELHWVMVEDEYGRDPALRFHNTSNLIFPLTMISKRVEDGKQVRVQDIYEGVMEHVEEFTE